jgi:FAD:protein FMN transferase
MKRPLLFITLALATTAPAAETVRLSGRAMGTTWIVKLSAPPAACDTAALRARLAEKLEALEQQLSTWRPASDLSRFNATATTDWFSVPPEVAAVAAESLRIAALTGGAFDPTVGPLVDLWGFGPAGRISVPPPPPAIAAARARVDWRTLEVRTAPPALRRTRASITVDFSSTAKGFAADALSALLAAEGLPRHLVQTGGDVRAGAAPAGRDGWPVAIEQPGEDVREPAAVVNLTHLAVSTAGDYRNFFDSTGRRHGHIIDPRTGAPVQGEVASVTVVHVSSATASSLATGLFVLGAEAGLRLAREQRLAALFIVRRGDALAQVATDELWSLVR